MRYRVGERFSCVLSVRIRDDIFLYSIGRSSFCQQLCLTSPFHDNVSKCRLVACLADGQESTSAKYVLDVPVVFKYDRFVCRSESGGNTFTFFLSEDKAAK